MSKIPGLDLKIIYLAAGHVETGGTQAHGLSEGRENIQVVEDALEYLHDHAGLERLGSWEYRLGDRLLVVVPHELDLLPTVRAINADYLRRPFYSGSAPMDWRWGVCIETHFNAPSRTAKGPMSIHYHSYPPSEALGTVAAEVLEEVTRLPCRHRHNETKVQEDGGGRGYYFLWATVPLALIIEMDELHNPERAAIVGDDQVDDVYGRALAGLVMRLAWVEEAQPDPEPEPFESWATAQILSLAERVTLLEDAVTRQPGRAARSVGRDVPVEQPGVSP